jgi:CspA family cold shock protein
MDDPIPQFNSRKMESKSRNLIAIILDTAEFEAAVKDACEKIEQVLEDFQQNYRNAHSLISFRDALLPKPKTQKMLGEIRYYNSLRGFGYLQANGNSDIWFHITDYHYNIDDEPRVGDSLTFNIVDGDKGPRAVNIEK